MLCHQGCLFCSSHIRYATFPEPLEVNALDTVRSLDTIVVAAPEMVAFFASSCVWIEEVTPSRYPSSVAVTSDTATFPEPLDVNALDTVRSFDTIVVAAPVTVACFASSAVCSNTHSCYSQITVCNHVLLSSKTRSKSIRCSLSVKCGLYHLFLAIVKSPSVIAVCFASSCVWIEEVTPSRYPSSVAVTSDTATFPEPLDVNALDTVRSFDTIVVAAPVTVACFASSAVCRPLVLAIVKSPSVIAVLFCIKLCLDRRRFVFQAPVKIQQLSLNR